MNPGKQGFTRPAFAFAMTARATLSATDPHPLSVTAHRAALFATAGAHECTEESAEPPLRDSFGGGAPLM